MKRKEDRSHLHSVICLLQYNSRIRPTILLANTHFDFRQIPARPSLYTLKELTLKVRGRFISTGSI